MLNSVLVIVFILFNAASAQIGTEADEIERGNAFVDKIIQDVMSNSNEIYDPLEFSGRTIDFETLNITGVAVLSKGYIHGMKNLRRMGHCSLTEDNGLWRVQAKLGAENITFSLPADVKVSTTTSSVVVNGKIPFLSIVITFKVNLTLGKNAMLEEFSNKETLGTTITIEGLDLVKWPADDLEEKIKTIYEHEVQSLIDERIKSYISKKIKDYEYPKKGDYQKEIFKQGDQFIDTIIKDMKNQLDKYDPYFLSNMTVSITKKVFFVDVTGKTELYNGIMIGTKSLYRPGHCAMIESNGRLKIYAIVAMRSLKGNYDGKISFMNFRSSIKVHAYVAYAEMKMNISVDSQTGRDAVLEGFAFDHLDGLQMWITGLGPYNWAFNFIIRGIQTTFRGFVHNVIENQLKPQITEEVRRYKFPVECRCGKFFDFSCCN